MLGLIVRLAKWVLRQLSFTRVDDTYYEMQTPSMQPSLRTPPNPQASIQQVPIDPFMAPLSQLLNGAAYMPGQLVDPTVSRIDPISGRDTIDMDGNGVPDIIERYSGRDIDADGVEDTNEIPPQ